MSDAPEQLDDAQQAHRTVQQSTAGAEEPLPAELEAAWERWSKGIGKVDTRAMTLLRAAFEAGWEGGTQSKKPI
ncbi:MAG: hypothetical protein AAGH92_04985 [Planctomycetota bacterium]